MMHAVHLVEGTTANHLDRLVLLKQTWKIQWRHASPDVRGRVPWVHFKDLSPFPCPLPSPNDLNFFCFLQTSQHLCSIINSRRHRYGLRQVYAKKVVLHRIPLVLGKEAVTDTFTTASINAKPPPYELGISGPTALPPPVGVVDADAGHSLHVQTGYRHDVPPFAVAALPELGGTAVEEGHENEQIPVAPAPMVGPRRAGPVSEGRRVPRDGRARGSGDARRGDEPRDDGGHVVGLAADVGDAGGRGLDEYGAGVVSAAGAEEYTGGEGEVAED